MSVKTFKILLDNNTENIGYIIYNLFNKQIIVSSLYISDKYQRQGYGTILIILFICYVLNTVDDSYYIRKISLDDCSKYNTTKKSIYYKLGFRILNSYTMEIMSINFLQPKPSKSKILKQHKYSDEIDEPSIIHYDTIFNYYDNLIENEKHKGLFQKLINDIKDNQIFIKIYNKNYSLNEYELITDNFDISKYINVKKKSSNLRSSKRQKTKEL
jgi:hypothetical protein